MFDDITRTIVQYSTQPVHVEGRALLRGLVVAPLDFLSTEICCHRRTLPLGPSMLTSVQSCVLGDLLG